MPERERRYTRAQEAEFAANRREAAKKAKYGGSYEQQGYRPVKEQGEAFLNRQELKAKFGAFANPTWSYEVRNGQVYRKPLPGQTGRITEQGGTAQWELAPDYVQRSYSNPRRQAFFAQNPDLANRPGGGQDAWLYNKFVTSLPVDPVSGLRVNQSGELYDPNAWGRPGYTGGAVGQVGQPQGRPPMTGGGFMAPGSPAGFGGGYGQPGGYIPGYAMPFSMPSYGLPQYGQRNLGQIGQPQGMQPPRPTNYRPLQQMGGSSFGSYRPQFGPSPFGQAPRY